MQYFFILGRNPSLSIAEIGALLEREGIKYKILSSSSEVFLIDTDNLAKSLFYELGGSIKFGEILGDYKTIDIQKFLPKGAAKIFFGFSFYKLNNALKERTLLKQQNEMKRIAMEIKKSLKDMGRSSRFVESRERALSSVIVTTNKLHAANGVEFVFLLDTNKVVVSKTLAVQRFKEYERRDYGRPKRNILRGMLPPKIAKIMLNLSGVSKTEILLDPFCGEGTILSEAAALGYKNLVGGDIDERAIEDTRVNLEWIRKEYPQKFNYELKKSDAREIFKYFAENSIDAIITEPYLGPLVRGKISKDEAVKLKNELENLYKKVFLGFTKILKLNGTIVFIFPVWRLNKEEIFVDLEKIVPPRLRVRNSCEIITAPELKNNCSDRGGILWQRPDQKVLREIMVLRKD